MENEINIPNENVGQVQGKPSWMQQHRNMLVIIAVVLLLFLFITLTASLFNHPPQPNPITPGVSSSPSQSVTQEPFHVLKTDPVNGKSDVFPGEITMEFDTDVPIISAQSFSLAFKPALAFPYTVTSSFPTKKVTVQIVGGLQKTTSYSVTIRNNNVIPVYSWTFTTSNSNPENSSQGVKEKEQQTINQYYPLFNYVPYSNSDFSIDYTDKLTLSVKVYNKNVALVKQEVTDWIKSHGVDPSTHTINYINSF